MLLLIIRPFLKSTCDLSHDSANHWDGSLECTSAEILENCRHPLHKLNLWYRRAWTIPRTTVPLPLLYTHNLTFVRCLLLQIAKEVFYLWKLYTSMKWILRKQSRRFVRKAVVVPSFTLLATVDYWFCLPAVSFCVAVCVGVCCSAHFTTKSVEKYISAHVAW